MALKVADITKEKLNLEFGRKLNTVRLYTFKLMLTMS